jgi:hypothetical protein
MAYNNGRHKESACTLTIAECPALKPTSHITRGRRLLPVLSWPVAASRNMDISSGTCAELPLRRKKPAGANFSERAVAAFSCSHSALLDAAAASNVAMPGSGIPNGTLCHTACPHQSTHYGIPITPYLFTMVIYRGTVLSVTLSVDLSSSGL